MIEKSGKKKSGLAPFLWGQPRAGRAHPQSDLSTRPVRPCAQIGIGILQLVFGMVSGATLDTTGARRTRRMDDHRGLQSRHFGTLGQASLA